MTTLATQTEEILVVKLGGGQGLDMLASCDDLAALALQRPLVIVHGVSAVANHLCEVNGVPVRMITSPTGHSSRYTDPQTRDLYVQAAGQVNRELVEYLRARGVNAVGLTGDETVISGERKTAIRAMLSGRRVIIHDDYSGSISGVNANRLFELLAQGFTPVLPPMAISDDGLLNVDGDRASAAVAGALHAGELVILSNVRGLYRNFPDENSFVAQVSSREFDSAFDWAQGRMKRKVLGAQEALNGGVRRVIIGDGRLEHPVQRALAGEGTSFTQ
jgi:acetylglutamate/LysW-gamma-L-alpha-aminoadipate kinase